MTSKTSQEVGNRHVPGAWWMVAVLFTFSVISMIDRLILTLLVGDIKADLHISDFYMSLVLGPAYAFAYAAAGVPFGWAVDRFKRRLLVFGGVTFWGLATIASSTAQSYEMLFILRVCVGIGEAVLAPAATSLIADAFPKGRVTAAIAVFNSASKVGNALAMALGGLIFASVTAWLVNNGNFFGVTQAWHLVMALAGIPGVLLAWLVFTFREPPRGGLVRVSIDGPTPGLLKFMRGHWQLWTGLLVGFSAISLVSFALTAWMPTYLNREFGWTPVQYGPALGATNLLSAFILVGNGWLVDRLYRRGYRDIHLRLYQWLIIAIYPAFALMFWVDSPRFAVACYALAQIVTVPFFMYLAAVIVTVSPPHMRGRLIAFYSVAFTLLGQGVGPTLIATITDFAYADEAKLGSSLAIVCLTGISIGLICTRWSLSHFGKLLDDQDKPNAPGLPIRSMPATD